MQLKSAWGRSASVVDAVAVAVAVSVAVAPVPGMFWRRASDPLSD